MPYKSLYIVVDNRAREGFRAAWGLSMLLEGDSRVLFDAGPSGDILLHNLSLCGCEPGDIDLFVLSHSHADHAGGLRTLVDSGFSGAIVLPAEDSRNGRAVGLTTREGTRPLGEGLTTVLLSSSGLYEQSLVAETPSGPLLLVGCSHPGLDRIWRKASEVASLFGVVGGFHGSRPFPELSAASLLAPIHCTQSREAFSRRFPSSFRDLAAGDRLHFGEEAG